jgi:ABC-type nitrate/sulfonate/bicarbonate transport system substrate-binding protein
LDFLIGAFVSYARHLLPALLISGAPTMHSFTHCRVRLALAAALLAVPGAALAETPLKMAVVSRTVFYLPAWTAEQQGFFKAAGLDVQMKVYDTSEQIFADLRGGSQDVAIASTESVIADAYKGGRLRIVAGNAQRPPHFIIVQPEIQSLAGLKGKLMGVVSMHEGTTFFVPDIARKAGLAAGDIRVEAVGGSPTRARLLRERKIDAGMQPYPLSYEAEAEGLRNLGPVADVVPDYQFTAIIVDEDWARSNRTMLIGFLRALKQGTEYMFAHPDEAAELGAKELRTTAAFARRALDDTAKMDILARDLRVSERSMRRVFDNVRAAELIPRDAAYDPSRFSDDRYVNEVAR